MNEKNIRPLSLDEIRQQKGKTDWDRLGEAGDHQGSPEVDIDWSSARLEVPDTKKAISLRVDREVLEFFKSQGRGYQTRINAVLRSYMEAVKSGRA